MEQTAAKIEIPDPRMNSRNGMITITGSIPAVIQARALLVVSCAETVSTKQFKRDLLK